MKRNQVLLFIFCFTIAFAYSQDIDRIEVYGKIVVDSVDVEGVTVYNTSSNKGTITDIEGKFSISVALNDRLEVSALQFEKFMVVINEDVIASKILTVFLVEKLNKLPEVIILPYGLSGYLSVDIESIKTFNPDMDAIYFGIQNMDEYEFTDDYKSAVTNLAMQKGQFYNGVDFVGIIGFLVKPLFDSKSRIFSNSTSTSTYDSLTAKYSLNYLKKNLNIPETKVDEFVYYVENSGFDKNLMQDGNELEFLEFLIDQSRQFKNTYTEKD